MELSTWLGLWYCIKYNYQYPGVIHIMWRISLYLWLMLIIMLHDNSDKGEWTLNCLANKKLLLVLWKLWVDDSVPDSCLFPYLIIMIPDSWILGQSLKFHLIRTTSYYCGTQMKTFFQLCYYGFNCHLA